MQKTARKSLIILTITLLLYSCLGFLVVPAIALETINSQLKRYSKELASLEQVKFNPFSLQLELHNLDIGQQLGFSGLSAQLSWSSIWQGKLILTNLQLEQPYAVISLDKQGSLNLVELFNLPEQQPTEDDKQNSELPLLVIQQTNLVDGRISFTDQQPRQPVTIDFDALDIDLANFSTLPNEQGQLSFKLSLSDGTKLNWRGELDISQLSSKGHLQLENLNLVSWWPYTDDFLTAELKSGRVNLSADYQINAAEQLQLTTSNGRLELNQLQLQHQQQQLLNLGQLAIHQVDFNLAKQQLFIKQISSSNLSTSVNFDQHGKLNWLELIKNTDQIDNNSKQEQKPSEQPQPLPKLAELPWHLRLAELKLTNHEISFSDNSQAESIELDIKQLNLSVQDFDSKQDQPVKLQLDSQLGEQGQITLNGQLNPHQLNAELELEAEDIDLRPTRGLIQPYAKVELISAFFNTKLNANISQLEPLQLTANGDIKLQQLHMRDQQFGRDLLKWHSLNLNNLSFSQQEQSSLSIDKIQIKQPYARLVIDQNLETNISKILVEQEENQDANSQEQPADFAFKLGKIEIEDGSANFADFSLRPHFATAIQQLNGHIGSIDSSHNQATEVAITGAVDRYAPVNIQGNLTPFDPLQKLDIATSFNKVELTTLTPYSGKFAGYRIRQGRLSLDLDYKITAGQLQAKNSILLEQFQLGEKVASEDAVNLPLPLAVALLKDSKGDIKINLPLSGDMNDPEFSVAPIIWQTLRNLITRAVAAPFKMLGSIAKSKQDLGKIGFAAADDQLTPSSMQALNDLAKALQARPNLKLNIEGTSSAQFDGHGVAEANLDNSYRRLWYRQLQERGQKVDSSIEELDVPPRQQNILLEQIYLQLPEAARAEQIEGNKEQRLEQMRNAVITFNSNNEILLRRLAQERAKNIREYLVEQGQINAERLFLIDVNDKQEVTDNQVNSILHLDVL